MVYSFKNKVALVTGGASGYGEVAVRRFVSKGVKVVIVDLNEELGVSLVAELNKNNSSPAAIFGKADVTFEAEMRAVYDLAINTFDHIALNNFGVGEMLQFDEDPKGLWRRVIDIDLNAAILGTILATEYIHKTGGGGGDQHRECAPIYTAVKHGAIGFTAALRPLLHTKKVVASAVPLTPVSSVVDSIFTAIENEDLVARVILISPKGVKVLPPVSAKL
ncbi:hypothetical protein BC828DRAFT_407444 [Blastocladiella britannica]|nr:hypothetical protein BC828DRAFT_407444 [Blastocladiella britannica]